MSFRVVDSAGVTTVFLDGEIDLERSPDARKALLHALSKGQSLLVDLAEVEYMDSSGLASLVEVHQRAREKSVEFALTRVSPPVMKVLQLARLDQVFAIRTSQTPAGKGK
jgi:anti-sigma B factor antagonist